MTQTSVWAIGASCVGASVVTLLWLLKRNHSIKPEYYERVQRRLKMEREKRLQLAKLLSEDSSLTADVLAHVLELPVLQLVEELRRGKLTAVQVLRAYQTKALEVTTLHNCITEFIPDAEERAAALDRLPEEQRQPLHGLPFSVKDCFNIAGMDSTIGLAKFLNQPAAETALLVQTLMQLGAVPFCKTNLPQTMMSFGCSNPVWGATTNIRDSSRTPGGSSSGEGVLVAAGGSPLGIGTDDGGSVRVPALFSGCYGLKPTSGRLSSVGFRPLLPDTYGIRGTPGFLAREISAVRLVMQLVTSPTEQADMYRLDPLLPRVFWNPQLAERSRKLRVGYLAECPNFPVTPGVKRVLTETVRALEKDGHELVPFHLPDANAEGIELLTLALMPENAVLTERYLAGEKVDPSMDAVASMLRTPLWRRKLIAWTSEGHFRYIPTRLRAYSHTPEDSVRVQGRWNRLVAGVVKRWKAQRLDILVMPGFPAPAPPADVISNLLVFAYYTLILNVLNFPAGTVTVGFETAEDQKALEAYPTPQLELKWIKEATRGAEGQPLGVQVVALPWMEEQVLAGMQTVQQALDRHNR